MRDSREKGAGMRDQDTPFQTLILLGMCVFWVGEHITRDMCFQVGEHISKDICFLGRGTQIIRDMCLVGRGTHITRDMCFLG